MWDPASKSRITNHAQDLLGALAAERHLTDSVSSWFSKDNISSHVESLNRANG